MPQMSQSFTYSYEKFLVSVQTSIHAQWVKLETTGGVEQLYIQKSWNV